MGSNLPTLCSGEMHSLWNGLWEMVRISMNRNWEGEVLRNTQRKKRGWQWKKFLQKKYKERRSKRRKWKTSHTGALASQGPVCVLGTELSTFHKTSSFNSHDHLIPLIAALKLSSKVTFFYPRGTKSLWWEQCLGKILQAMKCGWIWSGRLKNSTGKLLT